MLLRDPPGPAPRQREFQRLWLADACKRVTQDCLYQLQHPQRGLAIGFRPIAQVLAKLQLEDGLTFTGWSQGPTPGGASPTVLACLFCAERGAARPTGAGHSWGNEAYAQFRLTP